MLPADIISLVDSYVTVFDNTHPLAYKEREALRHARSGFDTQGANGPIRILMGSEIKDSLDQSDFVSMGHFLADFLRERTTHIWEKLEEAIKAIELHPYPELASDLKAYMNSKCAPHLKHVTQTVNETAQQHNLASGYVSEIIRLCSIVRSEIEADIQMFCAKYTTDYSRKNSGTITYNLHGPNSRVNINSKDYSVNISEAAKEIFPQIELAINESIQDVGKREELLLQTKEMQQSLGKPSFKATYLKWLSIVADHAQIITFAPYLSELLKKLGLN